MSVWRALADREGCGNAVLSLSKRVERQTRGLPSKSPSRSFASLEFFSCSPLCSVRSVESWMILDVPDRDSNEVLWCCLEKPDKMALVKSEAVLSSSSSSSSAVLKHGKTISFCSYINTFHITCSQSGVATCTKLCDSGPLEGSFFRERHRLRFQRFGE